MASRATNVTAKTRAKIKVKAKPKGKAAAVAKPKLKRAIAPDRPSQRLKPAPKASVVPARADPGTFGSLLDALDEVHPVPPELGRARRPYSWERETAAIDLVQHVDSRRLRAASDKRALSYWMNQSGGEGWGWELKFADAREVIDFVCVVDGGLACDDEPMLEDDERDLDQPPRPSRWLLSLAVLRPQVLRLLQQGGPNPFEPLIEAFNAGWGGIESIE